MSARVLIVEDDDRLRKNLGIFVDQIGLTTVGLAREASEAIAMAETAAPDLILMDINLPGGTSGIQAANTICLSRSVPIVYLTGNVSDEAFHKAQSSSIYGYLTKPYKDRDLEVALKVALIRRTSELTNRRFQEECAGHERLALVGELAGLLVHDLAGSVAIADGCFAAVLRQAESALESALDRIKHFADNGKIATSRMVQLVHSYKAALRGRLDEGITLCDVRESLAEVVQFCKPLTDELGIKVSLKVEPGLAVPMKKTLCFQAFLNLFKNAADAVEGRDQRWINIDAVSKGDAVVIRFADSGGGIAPDIRGHIFLPLFSTKPMERGTGLGLTSVLRTVTSLGGTIGLDDDPKSTIFVMSLPTAASG